MITCTCDGCGNKIPNPAVAIEFRGTVEVNGKRFRAPKNGTGHICPKCYSRPPLDTLVDKYRQELAGQGYPAWRYDD